MTAAEELGFSAKGVKGPFEALVDVPLPAIAHLKTEEGLGHFVVLHRVKNGSVVVADPARGVEKQSREEFCKHWTGYLLIVEPDEVRTLKASADAPIAPWQRFLRLLACHKSVRAEEGESRLLGIVQSLFSLQKLGISMSSAGLFVTGIAGIVILWYGGHRVIDGALTVGQLLFFYTLLGYMLGPLERLSTVNRQIQDALVAINRLYEIMDLEVEQLDDRRKAKLERVGEMIELEDVCRTPGTFPRGVENRGQPNRSHKWKREDETMRNELIIDLAECTEFRQALRAKAPRPRPRESSMEPRFCWSCYWPQCSLGWH